MRRRQFLAGATLAGAAPIFEKAAAAETSIVERFAAA
jgi:hypothetical protein